MHNVTKRIWYPILTRLGLPPRRPYQTRHTAATLWLAAGDNPEWIARQMGHSTNVVPQKPVEEQENPKPKVYSITWAQLSLTLG